MAPPSTEQFLHFPIPPRPSPPSPPSSPPPPQTLHQHPVSQHTLPSSTILYLLLKHLNDTIYPSKTLVPRLTKWSASHHKLPIAARLVCTIRRLVSRPLSHCPISSARCIAQPAFVPVPLSVDISEARLPNVEVQKPFAKCALDAN